MEYICLQCKNDILEKKVFRKMYRSMFYTPHFENNFLYLIPDTILLLKMKLLNLKIFQKIIQIFILNYLKNLKQFFTV
jgi:hypothetical protein